MCVCVFVFFMAKDYSEMMERLKCVRPVIRSYEDLLILGGAQLQSQVSKYANHARDLTPSALIVRYCSKNTWNGLKAYTSSPRASEASWARRRDAASASMKPCWVERGT